MVFSDLFDDLLLLEVPIVPIPQPHVNEFKLIVEFDVGLYLFPNA